MRSQFLGDSSTSLLNPLAASEATFLPQWEEASTDNLPRSESSEGKRHSKICGSITVRVEHPRSTCRPVPKQSGVSLNWRRKSTRGQTQIADRPIYLLIAIRT